MKKLLITVLIPLCGYAATAQTKRKPVVKKATKPVTATAVKFQTTLDSASYAFGSSMGASLKNDGLKTLNYDLLVKGLKDAFGAQAPLLSQEACQQVIGNLFKGLSSQKFASNINEGKTFLENNKKNAGVKTTASGLQYIVLTEGTGPKPAETDTVLVNYRGTLLNGTEFDSSYKRNEPLSLNLDRVIPGWTEGMQLMPAGSKYKFFIPYQLAYGERGAGEDIPPYSTLIFEIELLKVNGK